jgi:hypothetical protein
LKIYFGACLANIVVALQGDEIAGASIATGAVFIFFLVTHWNVKCTEVVILDFCEH